MKLSLTFGVVLLGGGLIDASSLSVYQDKTFYNFIPKNNFIGLTQGVMAKCDGATIPLSVVTDCPTEERLCQLLNGLEKAEQKKNAIAYNSQVLEKLILLPRPITFDVNEWIASAKLAGEEQANLFMQEELATQTLILKQKEFQKQAPSKEALTTTQSYNKEIELTIPHGYISFSTAYEASTIDEKEVSVTQYLSIENHSGIDLHADTAMFYYRSANQYVYPIHFNPWIVSKYEQQYTEEVTSKEVSMIPRNVSDAAPMVASIPTASHEDARKYKIQNLTLLSTGVPLDVKVITWNVPLSCEIHAYPYENVQAFQVCSFEPKYQIDSNEWRVKSEKEVINENAIGEYKDGKYHLYIKVEEDIEIERIPIVNKERETGIFGGTARKKDGFVLTLMNKSDKEKTLTLIDRIPASTTEEIEVKLLSIKSEKEVKYTMLKDGKIEMKLILAANENKKIEVLFEISYNKDLKVNY